MKSLLLKTYALELNALSWKRVIKIQSLMPFHICS